MTPPSDVGVIVVKRVTFTRDWDYTWVWEPRSGRIKCMNYSNCVGVRSALNSKDYCVQPFWGPAEGPGE